MYISEKINQLKENNINPFRHPTNNVRYLMGLFYEKVKADKSTVLYTLKDTDHEGFPSFYRLYMEIDDPTEWRVAQELMDGWDHWEILCEANWFKPYINRWRRELEIRMKSKALSRIRTEAKTNAKEALAANRYLLEKGWEAKEGKGRSNRGRPTKEEIKKAADHLASEERSLLEDMNRLRLVQ